MAAAAAALESVAGIAERGLRASKLMVSSLVRRIAAGIAGGHLMGVGHWGQSQGAGWLIVQRLGNRKQMFRVLAGVHKWIEDGGERGLPGAALE